MYPEWAIVPIPGEESFLSYRTFAAIFLVPILSATLLCQAEPPPAAPPSQPQTSPAQTETGNIMGTVTAENGDIVPDASVVVEGATPEDRHTATANDKGFFEVNDLTPGTPYHMAVRATGFEEWKSPAISVNPGQYFIVTDCKLKIEEVKTTVVVGEQSSVEIAHEQLKIEETQRVFGLIPNFYVAYDKNAAPLTAKMKFQLMLKTSVDPITFVGVFFVAGIDQGTDRPDYVEGAKGFGQRAGATYADGFSDVLVGGAILPVLLHQDPRYYYQGTGTTKSRMLHAMASAFICRGDNGKRQPNYSTIGGDLAASALSMTYYPSSDRTALYASENFLIDTADRMLSNLAQEFIFRKLTKAKQPK